MRKQITNSYRPAICSSYLPTRGVRLMMALDCWAVYFPLYTSHGEAVPWGGKYIYTNTQVYRLQATGCIGIKSGRAAATTTERVFLSDGNCACARQASTAGYSYWVESGRISMSLLWRILASGWMYCNVIIHYTCISFSNTIYHSQFPSTAGAV